MKYDFKHNSDTLVTKDGIRRFYDIGSPLYLEVYGSHIHDGYYISGKETKEEAQENLTRYIAEKARIRTGSRILDVGSGVGGSSFWLARNKQAKTVGITISPIQVQIATKQAQNQHLDSTFLLMDAEEMNFAEPFDAIWVVAASTHFQNQEGFVKSATAFLKRGGKFIVFDWMARENVIKILDDPYLKPVAEGMLLLSLCSIDSYLEWFIKNGYRITFAEDITDHTIKTWDVALSVIKEPSVLKLAPKIGKNDIKAALHFLKSIRSMKRAMSYGKLGSGVVVAEKL